MAFFFSAISAQAQKKVKGKRKEVESGGEEREDEDELATASQLASSSSQEWIEIHPTIINQKLFPSLTYWLALTTPNGAPSNPLTVHRTLLECGIDAMAKQVLNI